MRKIFVGLLIILVFGLSFGYSQQIVVGPLHTITFDEVNYGYGVITYEVWLRDSEGTDIYITEITLPPYTVDITGYEGIINVGVATKWVHDGTTDVSGINWSFENGVYTPVPFGLLRVVDKVKNMRLL
ncbi:hypothetical protein LCGC14_2617850 [marine sediment metagenome]|uniref:Uncharacterized protein n=1 Tax=marine sediment metagenome TaxID=412755 RepID=A0A0F9CWP0_9ZZZZ